MSAEPDEEAVSKLLHDLCAGKRAVRRAALRRLAKDQIIAGQVVPSLVAVLEDADPSIRLRAACVLHGIGAAAVPFLMDALDRASADFGRAIIRTVAMIGPDAQPAVPELTRLREHLELGKLAADALEAIHQTRLFSWWRAMELLLPLLLAIGALIALVHETLSWVEVMGQLRGVVREVAICWAVLGAFFGLVTGFSLQGRFGAYVGAKYLGMGGACAGASVGYMVGALVEPLARALGTS